MLRIANIDQVDELVRKYETLDVPRPSTKEFIHTLVERPDTWFVEIGDIGLVWLTYVVPDHTATANLVFWDKRFNQARREAVKTVLATAFTRFGLRRVSASAPFSARAYRTFLTKCGFKQEGLIREMFPTATGFEDLTVYGILKGELPWPVLLMTSLD